MNLTSRLRFCAVHFLAFAARLFESSGVGQRADAIVHIHAARVARRSPWPSTVVINRKKDPGRREDRGHRRSQRVSEREVPA
jgi:hypothetical protein